MTTPSYSAAKLEHPDCPGPGYLAERGLRLEIPLRLVPRVRARFSTRRNRLDTRMPIVKITLRRTLATLCTLAAFLGTTAIASATSRTSGRDHRFSANYIGHGHGETTGTSASGSATLRGRGRLIGRGTMSGSARGTFTSPTCVTFRGRVVLRGKTGSLRLRARSAQACAAGSESSVSFSGTATVTGGTRSFAGARGRLSFRGSFDRATGRVKVSLSGVIRYRA